MRNRFAAAFICSVSSFPGQALAGSIGGGRENDISPLRIVLAFLLCCLLGAAAIAVLKVRSGTSWSGLLKGRREQRRLRLVETLRIAPNSAIHIVAADDRELLIATTPAGISILSETRGSNIS